MTMTKGYTMNIYDNDYKKRENGTSLCAYAWQDTQKFSFKVGMKIASSIKIHKFPDFSRILDKNAEIP